jgi:hypothetical protein
MSKSSHIFYIPLRRVSRVHFLDRQASTLAAADSSAMASTYTPSTTVEGCGVPFCLGYAKYGIQIDMMVLVMG